MESFMLEESINNDFLSQSYLQGVKRITGTNNFDPKLEIPKKILENNWEVREKTWNNLFDKYSEEPSSDIQVNIITCEPEEEVSDEEHSCGQQIRMSKPAPLIQYWINTGNPPYKIFLNENEDIGSSLSEEESISLSEEESISLGEEENISLKRASFSLNKNNKQECRNNSSFSSVDTAAYILSNANITKKTDTMAIIEGAKCPNIKSSKNMKDVKTISNDKTEYMRIARSDQCDCSDANINTNLSNTEIGPTEHVVKMHTQSSTMSTNILQPNISQYSTCERIDKINTLKSSLKQLDVRNIHDIASIFQQFDKTSQRLAGNDKENITLDQIKVNRNTSDVKDQIEDNRNTSDVKQVSTSTVMTDTSKNNITIISQRKKLYTGRNSPIDLTLINRHNTNRLSQANHSLHPALDIDCMITRKNSFLSRKNKNKHLSLLDKKNLDLKKRIRKRKRSKFVKNNRDSNNSIISSYQSLSNFHDNTQDNIPSDKRITIQQTNDTNSFIKDEIYKQDLASLNLNPVVLLERITPFEHKSSLVKNNHNMQENSVHNKHFVKTRNLYDNENEDLQSRTSNTSTILISKHSKFSKNNKDSNNSIISSYQNLSNFHNNTQDDIPLYKKITIQKNNDTNSFIKDGIYKQDLASLNLCPVVLLERITPFKHKSSLVKNNHNMQKNSVRNKHFVKTSRNLYDCENEDLRSTTSNTSTILISKCEKDITQTEESSSSNSSFKLRVSIDDNNSSVKSSVSLENIEKKIDKLSSSKDTVMIQTKEPSILIESLSLLPNKNINTIVTSQVLNKDDDIKQKEVLDKSQIHLYGTNKIGSLNVKEIKISQINKNHIDSMQSQILNKNDAIQQKEILRESEALFSNSYKTNKDNIKFQEVKVVLEQLPTSLKKSITDINIYSDKNKISQNTSLRNNKIKSPIDNNSLKMCIKSKKNDKLNDTSDIVSQHENQVSDKAKSNSANYKCSILSLTSSDEDDFVKFLQNPKRFKRSSKSIDSKTLNETNTVNNRNLNTVIFSSKEATPRNIDNSIIENLNERDKTVPSVININNSRRLDTVIKRNEIDRKININIPNNIIFQTKTDYTDSLYFQESNRHSTFRKTLKSSSTQSKSRSNHINKERLFKSFTRNKYIINFSNSSNSSIEECDITKQSHNMLLRSTSRKAEVSKSSNEEFNDISLRSNNNTKKNNKSLSFINDKQDTSVEKETFVTSFGKNNLSNLPKSKRIPDKSKNSLAMQQNSSATKLLRFQTKSYYDSDSSISS